MRLTYRTSSPKETIALARLLAKEAKITSRAFVVALVGNIGAGKTTFIKGFAQGLGIRGRITSPTFVLMKYISIPKTKKVLVHIDAYRLKNHNEFSFVDSHHVFSNKHHIVVVEWARNIKKLLGKNILWISIKHSSHNNERTISLGIK